MSNEKNIQQQVDAERKKEKTSVLEKIRRRTGLLVGIVGLALIIFILESLLGSGASIFGDNEMATVGRIDGKKIDRNEFANRVEMMVQNYRQRNQTDVDEGIRASIIDNVWQQYVSELVIRPQFDKIGISVGDDEVYERVVAHPVQSVLQQLSDPNTGRVNDQIARPDGSLDLVKWKQVIQNLPADQDAAIRQMEDNVKTTRYFEKFRSIVKNGLYVTTAETKAAAYASNAQASVAYVAKRFDSVSDSTIKLSESDIQKYYNEHTWKFSNKETTRRIEYVAFNVIPSEGDLADLQKDAQRIADDFRKMKTTAEDSAFMQQESENGSITVQTFDKKTMIVRDSSIFTAAPGTVFGPYNEGVYFKVYKLEAVNQVADSARVRHILIGLNDPRSNQPKRSKEQAKREADSLLTLLKTKTLNFDTLVKTTSDDLGSIDKGGDYGWFDDKKGFVAPFKNAGLMGTKGNISVVETQFGYHIIEVLDVSAGKHASYEVAQIFKPIAASEETNQKIFNEANEFGGMNNTAELFDKAIETKKLTKRIAENIKEGDRQLPGLSQARELVRWVYTAKKGDIATFSLPDKHIVAKVTGIRNKGILPLEEVMTEATEQATQAKKAEMFVADLSSKAGSAKTASEVAAKTGLQLMTSENLNLAGNNVEGLGFDPAFVGTVMGLQTGATSKPVIGSTSVFVVSLNKVNTTPENPEELKAKKRELEQGLSSRSDYEVINALKENADIEDHKSRID